MKITLHSGSFEKQMFNIIDYSVGFLDGVQRGKSVFLKNLAKGTVNVLENYIDANARIDNQALQHMYEWYKTGSPQARLFDIQYTVRGDGISINSTFRQSKTMSKDSTDVFYNKARIIENGIPITIKPTKSSVLVFEEGGQTIFTKKEIKVQFPGGPGARGSYQKVFDEFFRLYFSQSFLKSSGLVDYLENPMAYKLNFANGAKGGKSVGNQTGHTWIINAGIGVE